MLEELDIRNYALIESIRVSFAEGFNVLTGETGAGKSILVGSLGLLLGQKADPATVRSGASEMLVSGVVRVAENPEACRWLAEHGIEPEDGSIMIRRIAKKSGRGSIHVQSVPVTKAELAELTSMLFDLHGQHDHQSLLRAGNHRQLLDRFGETEDLAGAAAELYAELSALQERYDRTMRNERERLREIDLLGFAVSEIDEAGLRPGEEEELENEHRILSNHEKLFRFVQEVYEATAESRGGALAGLREARNKLEELLEIDSGLSRTVGQLQDAFYELEDVAESIRAYRSQLQFDPARLAETEERLFLIRSLEKKYGDTVKDVLDYAEKSRRDLDELENWEDKKKSLQEEIERTGEKLRATAEELSRKRREAAGRLEKLIEQELHQLGMTKVRFKVLVQARKDEDGRPKINQHGMDLIEFVLSTNPGEPFKRLIKIASGGELSRVMLAIKSILAASDHIGSMIFDEVDAGIGGEVALAVGERLQQLSRIKQVLCVTHLATIAVRADNHLKVEKAQKGDRTVTLVSRITGQQKKGEISRMLAGDSSNQAALKHAEDLLSKYAVREVER